MTTLIEHPTFFTTLPREYYVSDDIFEQEIERIFFRQWLYAGHLSELRNRGDFRRYDFAGESIVLVRGEGDSVHGFFVHIGVWHGLMFMCLSRDEPEPIAEVLERVAPELEG
jgi:phenylpropionate dioxygenase-like ring-hydroxylating dioxygenase large terminal subunit